MTGSDQKLRCLAVRASLDPSLSLRANPNQSGIARPLDLAH